MSWVFLVLCWVLGVIVLVLGIKYLPSDDAQQATFAKAQVAVGKGVFLILLALGVMIGSLFAFTGGYFDPKLRPEVTDPPLPSVLGTELSAGATSTPSKVQTSAADPTPAATETTLRRVFLSPRRKLYCATYVDSDQMGCVMLDRDYGPKSPGCAYLNILGRTGRPTVKACAGAEELSRMYGVPPTEDDRISEYGVVRLGRATCRINRSFTACSNDEGHGFSLTGKANELF